jgi:hypothetical protein
MMPSAAGSKPSQPALPQRHHPPVGFDDVSDGIRPRTARLKLVVKNLNGTRFRFRSRQLKQSWSSVGIDIPLQCHEAHRRQSDGEFRLLARCNHPPHLPGDATASGVSRLLIRQLLFEGVQ